MAGSQPRGMAGFIRLVAGVLAIASFVPLCVGLAIVWLTVAAAAQRPDATVPDGDPCCGHPDTWGEVFRGIATGMAEAALCAGLLYTAITLSQLAAQGVKPRLWSLRRLVASATLIVTVSMVFTA